MKTKKKNSVQDLLGIESFTKYGIQTRHGELLFFQVEPTNISVLSHASIEMKIYHLLMVLSSIPDVEIVCTDSTECFDENKIYLKRRWEAERNRSVRDIIEKDIGFLDKIQVEMASSRQFLFVVRIKNGGSKNVFDLANTAQKYISDECFEVHRLDKSEIKRLLARYFEASMAGEQMPDADGEDLIFVAERKEGGKSV